MPRLFERNRRSALRATMGAMNTRSRTALVVGASGLVGRALLRQLAAPDSGCAAVHALVRKPITPAPKGVQQHVVDFSQPPLTAPAADDLYCALGTTIKVAGSKEAFRAVDFDAVVNAARAAQAAGATRMAVVSAMGASPASPVFYNRVKGDTEAALRAMNFQRLVIVRPSLLVGPRDTLGQASRPGEALMIKVFTPISALLPASIRPIHAQVVARAMCVALHQSGDAAQVIESGELQQLGKA
jgi:uncharacterized protein YbjT (DUF2867 family)